MTTASAIGKWWSFTRIPDKRCVHHLLMIVCGVSVVINNSEGFYQDHAREQIN
jgi:hypothetical protein